MHPLSEPLQPGVRFFRDPLPTTDARQFTPPLVAPRGATPLWAYPVPCGEHEPGGPRLSAGDRHVSVPPPSREATGHVPFWFEPVSRFGSFKLDGIYQRFTDVGPLAQPCASSGFRLPESHGNLTAAAYPRGAATLSVRSARGRYQPRTAPRLRAAERPVARRLAPEQQLITRLAPRLQPNPGFPRLSAFRPVSIRLSPDHVTPYGHS